MLCPSDTRLPATTSWSYFGSMEWDGAGFERVDGDNGIDNPVGFASLQDYD